MNTKTVNSAKKSVFFPPGVQAKLYSRFGTCPRELPVAAANKVEALWAARCKCDESEVAGIDAQMEEIAAIEKAS